MKASRRMVALDLLRTLAVVLVVGHHLQPLDSVFPDWLHPLAQRWIEIGWIGVDLFFVLSGFLISGLLFQEYQRDGKIRVGRFLIRRAFKIYPSFYVFIAIVVYIQFSNYNYQLASTKQILAEALFVQNYFPGLLFHTWSLGVEEQFYLLLPLTLLGFLALGRRDAPFRTLPIFWALGALLLIALRTWLFFQKTMVNQGDLRFDSLLCGVALSYFYHFHSARTLGCARKWRWHFMLAGCLLLVPVCMFPNGNLYMDSVGLASTYIGFAMILLASLAFAIPSHGVGSIPFRVAAFCGAYSYGIYLWHMPVKLWGTMYLTRWFGWRFSASSELLVYLLGSFAVGIFFSIMVERPFLLLRDRWFPSKTGPVEPSKGPADFAAEPVAPIAFW